MICLVNSIYILISWYYFKYIYVNIKTKYFKLYSQNS